MEEQRLPAGTPCIKKSARKKPEKTISFTLLVSLKTRH